MRDEVGEHRASELSTAAGHDHLGHWILRGREDFIARRRCPPGASTTRPDPEQLPPVSTSAAVTTAVRAGRP
jgi:hypothetical protein